MAMTATAMDPTNGAATGEEGAGVDAPDLRYFVFALFFIFGGITSLNDVIIPKLKELFTLNYTQAMLVQFCFFTAYARDRHSRARCWSSGSAICAARSPGW